MSPAPIATNASSVDLPSTASSSPRPVAICDAASNRPTPDLLGVLPLFLPKDQLFFWTRAWQEGERESAEGREAGEVVEFDSATDLLKWLLSDDD